MIFTRILATGGYLPETVLSNKELEARVDTTHEWILERTGIKNRHISQAHETTVFMASEAAKKALEAAHITAKEIDMVVVATCTPDKIFPSTACLIQSQLDIPPCPAFDIQAACSGFLYALSVVDKFIKTGSIKRALVIGSERMSKIVDWTDRRTCILFGDGAGAVIVERSETPGILSTYLGADGHYHDILYADEKTNATVQMQGNSVFKLAVNMLDHMASETLGKENLSVADIDWLVPHQANIRIIKATADKLGLPMDRVVVTLEDQGNTSSASIPLALDAAVRGGRIKRDQHLLLEAFGGGLTWGTALIRY
jgi:3-oxoacyl-[acyl-carrier-protein] synthase-3